MASYGRAQVQSHAFPLGRSPRGSHKESVGSVPLQEDPPDPQQNAEGDPGTACAALKPYVRLVLGTKVARPRHSVCTDKTLAPVHRKVSRETAGKYTALLSLWRRRLQVSDVITRCSVCDIVPFSIRRRSRKRHARCRNVRENVHNGEDKHCSR
jgi:hypothetical protein